MLYNTVPLIFRNRTSHPKMGQILAQMDAVMEDYANVDSPPKTKKKSPEIMGGITLPEPPIVSEIYRIFM